MYSENRSLHLAKASGATLVSVGTAEVPAAGLTDMHNIFGIMKHPTKPWLYVSSFIEYDWGNARIDRFTVSKDGIAYAGVAFLYDENATLAGCAPSAPGDTGYCAPVDGTFSANGSRLFVQEDGNDTLDIFQVNADGSLTMLSESGEMDMHGVAMDPTGVGTYLYNGSNVLEVAGDTAINGSYDTGGNYTTYLVRQAGNLLLTTGSTNDVAIYSLADPAAPVAVDVLTIGTDKARAVVINSAGNRLVTVGKNSVATVGFDGAALTLEDSFDPSGGGTVIQNRSVSLVGDGSAAAVAWFEPSTATSIGYIGGVTLYSIAPDGTLGTIGTVPVSGSSRVVKTMTLP